MLGQGQLDAQLHQFLLTGGVGVQEKEVPRPRAEWLSDKAWGEICRAANVSKAFTSLPDDIAKNVDAWKPIFDSVSG